MFFVRTPTLESILAPDEVVYVPSPRYQRRRVPYLSTVRASATAPLSTDERAATYFGKTLSDPDLEDAIVVRKDGIESIADARTPNSAALNQDKLISFATSYKPGDVMYHQHPANPTAVIQQVLASGNRQLAQALIRLPSEHPLFTTLYHVPSDADMRTALSVQALGYTAHNHTIEQRIAVMEDGKPIKAIGYGLSKQGQERYRSLHQDAMQKAQAYQQNKTRSNHNAMTKAGRAFGTYVQSQLTAYKGELDRFQQDLMRWRPSDGELSAKQFYDRVKANTDLEITDRGTVGDAVAVTPEARVVREITGLTLTQRKLRDLRAAYASRTQNYLPSGKRLNLPQLPAVPYSPLRAAYASAYLPCAA